MRLQNTYETQTFFKCNKSESSFTITFILTTIKLRFQICYVTSKMCNKISESFRNCFSNQTVSKKLVLLFITFTYFLAVNAN